MNRVRAQISVVISGCALLICSASAHAMGRKKLDLHALEGTYTLAADQSDPTCPRENTVHYDADKGEIDSANFTFKDIGKPSHVVGTSTTPSGIPTQAVQSTSLSKDTLTQTIETSEVTSAGDSDSASGNGSHVIDTLKVSLQYRDGLLVRYAEMNGEMTSRGLCTYVKEPLGELTAEEQAGIAETADQDGPKQEGPDWLYEPGFHAILGSVQDESFIFIESSETGLIFRYCESGVGPGDDVIAGNQMPTACPTLLNNESMAIPPNVLLEQSLGISRILMTAVKVAASGAIIGLTNISWGYLTSAAAMVNSALPADPIGDIQDYTSAKNEIDKMLEYGNLSEKKQDGYIVTELLDQPYADIKSGVLSELTQIVKGMDKHDETLTLRRDLAYHALMNRRYAQLHAQANPPTKP